MKNTGFIHKNAAFTLIELLAVVTIIAVVATIAVAGFKGQREKAMLTAAEADMQAMRGAIIGSEAGPACYLADMQELPGFTPVFMRPHNLLNRTNIVVLACSAVGNEHFYLYDDVAAAELTSCASYYAFTNFNAQTERGWNGPYIRNVKPVQLWDNADMLFPKASDKRFAADKTFLDRRFFPAGYEQELSDAEGSGASFISYGVPGELAMGDPWGNPYVIQIPPAEAVEALSPSEADEDEYSATRFKYARIVSAGPDGVLDTPCFVNPDPAYSTELFQPSDSKEKYRMLLLAGRTLDDDGSPCIKARGDDVVLFLMREDVYEE